MFARAAIRFVLPIVLALPPVALAISTAWAGECTNNRFQPTFVRHNMNAPQVYYVEPGGGFASMRSPAEAQATCRQRGVRQLIGGANCSRRGWGDFGCGCNITPSPNRTCARFQVFLRNLRATADQFCRNLYARGQQLNRSGTAARTRRNYQAAQNLYNQAMAVFDQGLRDPRCRGFVAQYRNAVSIVQRNRQRVANDLRRTRIQPPSSRRNAFCDQYARTAVRQQQENRRRGCGGSGPRWQTNYNNHYGWCTSASRSAATYEQTQRTNTLRRCGR